MNWRSEWAAIAARVEGLVNAGHFFVRTLAINSSDMYNVTDKHLGREAKEITASLKSFLNDHGGAIPHEAAEAIHHFLSYYAAAIEDAGVKGIDGLKLRITSVAAVKSAVDYHSRTL